MYDNEYQKKLNKVEPRITLNRNIYMCKKGSFQEFVKGDRIHLLTVESNFLDFEQGC